MWGFGTKHADYDEQEFRNRLIEGKIGEVKHNSVWKCIRDGIVEGVLIGGNLNCLNKLAGTKYLPDFEAKILLLESFDQSNPPEKVEAELYRLKRQNELIEYI